MLIEAYLQYAISVVQKMWCHLVAYLTYRYFSDDNADIYVVDVYVVIMHGVVPL